MSTISFSLATQALDFAPLSRGRVRIVFNNGSQNIFLDELLSTSVATTGRFQEVPWINGFSDEDEQQAENFVFAFNRDYSFIGNIPDGTPQKGNIVATNVGNVITITATVGTFSVGSSYDGNVLVASAFTINNTTQAVPVNLSVSNNNIGSCTLVNFAFSATGDGAPFRLNIGGADVDTNWDGTSQNFDLQRGKTILVSLYNSSDELVDSETVFVPRKLVSGDFDFEVSTYEDNTSDIIINRVTVINFTTPLEYSLDDLSEATGTTYQSQNNYSGIPSGQYNLFIRDVYGCEIVKIIDIPDFQDATKTEVVRYFQVMQGQSLIFTEMPEFSPLVKKNYFNTGSYNEFVQGNRFDAFHYFDDADGLKGIQFKSSYNYHVITLHKCDGTKIDLAPIIISQNLGALEKMDCVVFSVGTNKTGVYFNGGNTYIPNTETVLDSSIYDGTTPSWAEVGQLVFLDGTGLRITGNGFDSNRGWYFIVDLDTSAEVAATVQVTYNKQDYNTFEAYFDVRDIDTKGFIVIEKGFLNGSEVAIVGNPWVCEVIRKISDTDEYLLIEWSDVKNKSDIVFQSGIGFIARMKGELIPGSNDSSETFSGDSNEYSIEQIRRIAFDVFIEGITFKQVIQLNIASALSGFKVNGISLVSNGAPSHKRMDKSNLYTWRGKFGYGANMVAEENDEIVLSVSTGVEGGGGTGQTIQPNLTQITLFKFSDGTLARLNNGTLLKA